MLFNDFMQKKKKKRRNKPPYLFELIGVPVVPIKILVEHGEEGGLSESPGAAEDETYVFFNFPYKVGFVAEKNSRSCPPFSKRIAPIAQVPLRTLLAPRGTTTRRKKKKKPYSLFILLFIFCQTGGKLSLKKRNTLKLRSFQHYEGSERTQSSNSSWEN